MKLDQKTQKLRSTVEECEKKAIYYRQLYLEDGFIDEVEQKNLDRLFLTIQKIKSHLQQLEEEEAPTTDFEDDWTSILANTQLSNRVKETLTNVIKTASLSNEQASELILLIYNFYKYRYSNHEKYAQNPTGKLGLKKEEYLALLEQSIVYSLDQSGTKVNRLELSKNFILLLKGVLKSEEAQAEKVQVEGKPGNKFNITFSIGEQSMPSWTERLNKLKLFQKGIGIEDTTLAASVEFSATYQANQVVEADITKLTDELKLVGKAITHDRNISLNGDKLETAIAGGELELELDTKFGKVVLGIKLTELAVAEAVSLKPIVGTLKWEASDTLNPDWVGTYPEMAKLATFAMTIQGTVETTAKIDLDQFISDEKIKKQLGKFEADHKRLLQEKVKIDRKQKAINDLIKQEHELSDLQKQYRQLTDKVKKARGKGNKQKDLLAKKGRAFLEIRSKTAAFEQQLKAEGAGNLEQLKEQLDLKNKGLKDKLGLVEQHFNQIVDKADHQIKGVLKAAKKQVGKRIVSGIMKIIPGLNVISLAMDLYDAYTLYQDISAAYFESRSAVLSEDEFIEQDEELRALKYGTIPLEELPEILLVFFTAIGAGGKLAELKPEEAVQFENFFKEAFTDGIDGVEFDQFLFRYGEVYEITGGNIKTNLDLLRSVREEYKNKDTITQEGRVVKHFDDNQSSGSNFFHNAIYKVVSGNINELGTVIGIDGIGEDMDSKGKTRRVIIPDDNLINLKVTKIPDSETIELVVIEDYILEVEDFKTYKLSKGAKFIYNINQTKLTRYRK